ncbi:MAG TPA: DNA replication/repair protein RecF [Acholeplasmataceae bacterium]|nr:DNA replication/repair protein RecF [Acholeplasmataceae bacterium]
MSFYLKQIQLINFRCYQNRTFKFAPGKNLIVGTNAVGKTSLMEGIYCLGFAKTFRNVKDVDLINKGNSFYNLKGEFFNNGEIDKVISSYNQENKRIIKNNQIYKTISDYLGYFNIICFDPDDLELVKGGPSVRRKFLDVNIGQINHKYLNALIKLKKILKERNEYLKSVDINNFDKVLLDILTTSLVKEAEIIISERKRFINELNTYLNPILNQISSQRENVEIVYKPNCNVDKLWKTSQEKVTQDIIMQTTTWGPNRDEVLILVNGEIAANYCSQGQIRSTCLTIKLGLVEMIKKITDRIIVILDDVFSELDCHRQNEIVKMLDNNIQTFITTTSIQSLNNNIISESNVVEIERGNDDERI